MSSLNPRVKIFEQTLNQHFHQNTCSSSVSLVGDMWDCTDEFPKDWFVKQNFILLVCRDILQKLICLELMQVSHLKNGGRRVGLMKNMIHVVGFSGIAGTIWVVDSPEEDDRQIKRFEQLLDILLKLKRIAEQETCIVDQFKDKRFYIGRMIVGQYDELIVSLFLNT